MNKFKENYINLIVNAFILFQLINFINPLLLNNIIRIGDNNFRYCHFSYNSYGDMILEISSFPVSEGRRFFGLKYNGEFYFNSISNQKAAHYSLTMNHKSGRIEGESFFVKLTSSNSNFHGKELIYGISKYAPDSGDCVEVYNLDSKNSTKYSASYFFGKIISDSFSFFKAPDDADSQYLYTIAYIASYNNNYFINIKKTYFTFDNGNGYRHIKELSYQAGNHKEISCFYTENSNYICFYLNNNKYLVIMVIKSDFSDTPVNTYVYQSKYYGDRFFFKGIHLKGEIGFFIYFKANTNSPTISIYQCDNNYNMVAYSNFVNINVGKTTFNSDLLLNDIVKLNDYQVCYFSIDTDKIYFKFVIFILYKNDELMNIRYYKIEIWTTYRMKIYLDLKASLYKNFISLAFSHCPQTNCQSAYDLHYASLIIFNYPNSTEASLDIIPLLYTSNQKIENDFSFNFNLEGTFSIENNLFGLVYKGIRIMKYYTGLFFTNTTNKSKIETESVVLKDENVSLYFETHENYEKKNYRIEYANVLEEPNYSVTNAYMENIDESYGNSIENENNYYRKYEYTGKSSNFTIIIKDNLITDCNSHSCSLCFSNYTCVTCKYNFTFNGNIKECFNPFLPTTILTTIPTTNSTTIPENQTTILNILTTYISNNDINFTTIPVIIAHEEDCTVDEIMKGQCKGRMTNYQIKEIYDILKHNISDDSINIIETENVIFQLSTFEEQKNSNNPNVSSIDLGKCEELIKSQEGLNEDDNLIVLKTDIKSDDLTSTYVQYEIYNPFTLKLISLDICKDIPIGVTIPVNLDENTQSIYDSLSQSGYNLFDLNDSFYNDICTTYTTENGTDLTLADRKNLIYDNNGNVSMCQEDCTFQSFNLTTRKAKCDCSVQTEVTITDVKKINFDKNEIVGNFFKTLKNSNFLVLKCYKLVFSAKGQKKILEVI